MRSRDQQGNNNRLLFMNYEILELCFVSANEEFQYERIFANCELLKFA